MAYIPNRTPWNWNVFFSVRWQAFLSAIVALLILGIGWAALTPAQDSITRVLTTALHEVGHYVMALATGSQAFGIEIRADGSGHVSVATSDPLSSILVAAAGILTVALVSAAFLYSGLTRIGMHVFLASMGLLCVILCLIVAEDPEVCLVLLVVGALALFVGYMPGAPFLKAVVLLYLSFVLVLGVLGGLGYAYSEVAGVPPNEHASDSKIIADALGTQVRYVGNALIATIALIYAISAVFVAAWLHQNE